MTLQDETTLAPEHDRLGDDDAIPLPEVTRRSESRRRRAARRRQRRAQLLRYAGIGLAVVVVLTLLVKAWPDGGGGGADEDAEGSATPAASKASAPVLLAQQDAAGNAVSLTLLVPAEKDKGGSLLLIPPGTMTEVASLGLEPVGKSLGLGGAQRLDATVENLLGVSIGEVLALDDSRLAALVQPVGPLSIRVPERVETVDALGRVDVLYEPGLHKVQPQDVPAFLSVKGSGNDLARLARHQAFWDAWLAALRQNPKAAPGAPGGLKAAFGALVAGGADDVATRVLPVQALGTASDDGELYQVDAEQVRQLVVALFPAQKGADLGAARPRLQVLNGTGAVGLAQSVSDRLLGVGEIKLTGNAGRLDYQETQIVFYRRGDEAVAQRVQKTLGVGKLVFSRNPLDVVDITVIVGRDFKPA